MTPNAWFDTLRDALETTSSLGAGDAVIPEIDEESRGLLLDLARIAAHRAERWTAPLSTYLVGHALAAATPDGRIAALRALVDALEVLDETDATEGDT